MFIKIMVCIVVIVLCVYIITERQNKKLDAQIAERKKAKEQAAPVKSFIIEDDVFTPDDVADKNVGDIEASATSFVHFETEPDNPYDSKAIKVMSGDDCIGYVFKGRLQDTLHEYAEKGRASDVIAYICHVYDEEDQEQDRKVLYRIKATFKK